MKQHLLPILCLSTLVLCGDHDDISNALGTPRSQRTWDESYELARAFVGKLNTLEKVSLSSGSGISLGPCSGNTQDIDRLGFREMCFQDGPVGVRGADLVSVFPAGITTGSTWDRELMYLRSRAMGVENRIKGVNVALAPVAGALGRAPAAGRNWEAFGADPYLTGVANAESVKGLQDEGVIACAKHFIGNEQERYRLVIENIPNIDREILASLSSQIDERTLRELYEWPFIDAVEAGAGSVMCSYQRVNNEYSCESATLIRDHLKSNASGGLNFKGFVMTDWFASAIPSLAARAGVDIIMPGDLGLTGGVAALLPASDGASTNGTRLDEMVIRLVASWYKMRQEVNWPDVSFSTWSSDDIGLFLDRGYFGTINYHVQASQPIHATLIRRIAAEGTTLLKNKNGALPLAAAPLSIGVFGNDAGPIPSDSCGSFGACSNGTLAVGWGSGSGTFETLVDPLQAITVKASEIGGTVESVLDDYAYAEMTQKAAGKDVCLAFINSRSGENTNSVEGNYGDRNNLTAWRDGDTLVKTVTSVCSNTVVVIHSVGPILLEEWIDNPNVTAVLLAHLPGEESGNSLVDVLWGAVNPSGKLPYTMAKTEPDYCCRVQYDWAGFQPEQEFSEGLFIDYRWFDKQNIEPRFEFGFGLSYTNFTYNTNTLSITVPSDTDNTGFLAPLFSVSIDITNSGTVSGKEVAQLYLKFPASTNSPVRQLRGFEKLSLAPGETKTATFVVTKRDVSYWDVGSSQWTVALGEEYGVEVSASSRDVKVEGTVRF